MTVTSSDTWVPLPTRVLVFAPYLEEDGRLVSPHYDPPEYRAEIGEWLQALGAEWEWVSITARTLDAEIARARALAEDGGVLVFNLCDGTVSDRFPGIEVVTALEAHSLPYTGASEDFYRITTSKAASKARLHSAGVATSPWVLARSEDDVERAAATLPFPLFVKPDVSAGSYGIQIDSVARDIAAARRQFNAIRAGLHGQAFEDDAVLVERFIEGREFTVLVVEDPREPLGLFVLAPGERVFDKRVPASERFLAYERYWSLPEEDRPIPEGEPYYWYELAPPEFSPSLADLARRAFRAVGGEGYARVDIRLDEHSGEQLVLEVNAQCGLSTSDSSTVGSLLNLCGQPMPPVIERVIRHGMARAPSGAPEGTPYVPLEQSRLFVPVFIAHAEQEGRLINPEFEAPWVRTEIDGWMRSLRCDWEWVAISPSNLRAEIKRVRDLSGLRRTVVLNLCDGDDVNGYPGLSVVKALEAAGVPFTGARSRFYEISTSKRASKQRFADRGVRTPPCVHIRDAKTDIGHAGDTLGWPIFVKPDVSAGSSGISASSRANNLDEGYRAVAMAFANMDGYESWEGGLIAEPFLAGREFTVLVVSDAVAQDGLHAFAPVERVFSATIPVDERFLTCDRVMWEGDDAEAYSYAPAPEELHDELLDLARRAVLAVEGSGYARVDIRYDADPGVPYVLEVNANCGISEDVSSAVGSILQHSGASIGSFIDTIMADALRTTRTPRAPRARQDVSFMNVCVLQPSYDKSELLKEYATHDPPRDLAALVPEWSFTHVFLHKATVYTQLKDLKHDGYDIFVNLCEGHLDWDVPSIDVIHALDSLGLPYTGPAADRYETRKEMLKVVARYAQVHTPPHVLARSAADVTEAAERLRFPLFVKPGEGGDSFGIDEASLCPDRQALDSKANALLRQYDSILIEEYLDGREFSVLVAADSTNPKTPLAFRPIEYRFPVGERFKTYDLKNAQYHPEANISVEDPALEAALIDAARRVFLTFGASGYCRMDFRLDADNVPSVLDANFTCSIFYAEGFYGTADYILQHDGFGTANFLRHIVREGLARHRSLQKAYAVRTKNGGLGIDTVRAITRGEVVFIGEERSQRVVTRRWVEETWDARDRQTFAQYAYPLSDEVYILWSDNPLDWAPQNHSCDANCHYDGLNVVALRDICAGEELTLDYAQFCNEQSAGFDCHCGAPNCRGFITGTPGTGVDTREKARRT